MTDTQQTQSAPPRGALHRSREGNILGGVAAGLGERFAISAWWFRFAFVILAFVAGFGVALYVLAWLFIPAEGDERALAIEWIESVDLTDTGTIVGVALMGAAAVVIATQVINIPGSVIFAAILFAVGILLYRGDLSTTDNRLPTPQDRKDPDPTDDDGPDSNDEWSDTSDDSLPTTEVGGVPVASAVVAGGVADGGVVDPPKVKKVKEPKPPRPKKPKKEPSMLGRLTIAAVLIVLSVMALLEASGIAIGSSESGDLFDPVHYGATALAIIGIGLVIGAFMGRARWLIVVGLLLLPFVFLSSLWPRAFDWTARDAYFHPSSPSEVQDEYSQGAGQLSIDLSNLTADELAEVGEVEVTVGAGEATIFVPSDVGVHVSAEVGLGQVALIKENQHEYVDGSESFYEMSETFIDTRNGVNARMERGVGDPPYVLRLDAEVGAGRVVVRITDRYES